MHPHISGDASVVRRLLDGSAACPLLLILPGLLRGAHGAGVVVALHKLGLAKKFRWVVGVSTGAAIGGYFLAGEEQTRIGSSIYYEECLTDKFLNLRRWPMADIGWLIRDVMGQGPKRLDCEAIRRHPTEFFVGLTTRRGKPLIVDAKGIELSAIEGSMALPGAYGVQPVVGGIPVTDGGLSVPFAVAEVVRQFVPSDVLVLPNQWRSVRRLSVGEAIISSLAFEAGAHIGRLALSRRRRFSQGVDEVERRGGQFGNTRVAILWPPRIPIGALERDSQRVRRAVALSARRTLSIFGSSHREVRLL